MKRFWQYHGWEALLCLLAAATLVLNFSQGFYIPDNVADSVPLALAVCAVTLLYAYLGSYDRKTMVGFTAGFVVLAVVFFLWMRSAGIDVVDEEGSDTAVYIYYIAAPLISLLAFLLSRSRAGTAILFLLGCCMDALFTFLGYEVKIWCAVLFPAAVAALFLMRQYRVTALKSSTVEPRFGAYFAWAAGLSLVGMVLALGMWGLVIRPLQPPTVDAALLTKYMRYEIFERVGIASQYPELSDEETQTPPEQTQQANEPEQQEDAPEQAQAPVEPETSEEPSPAQAESSLWNPAETETVQSVSYAQDMTAWLVVLIVLLVILLASVPFLRRLWRRQRLDALCRGTSQEQVVGLYRFYLKKFARIGYPRGPNQTEWEYAARYGEQLAPFLEGGPDLERMTALYMDARYGGLAASEEDCRAMAVLYPAFLRNYKELAGRMRYWKYYFVL